jgi:hypothetical protein
MKLVESRIAQVALMLRDVSGVVHRWASAELAGQMDKLYGESLSLWAAAQKLSHETFYNEKDLTEAHEAAKYIGAAKAKLEADAKIEKAKGANADAGKVQGYEKRIGEMATILRVMDRLGLAGADDELQ